MDNDHPQAAVLAERRRGVLDELKQRYSPEDHVFDEDFDKALEGLVEDIEQLFLDRYDDRRSDNLGDQAE